MGSNEMAGTAELEVRSVSDTARMIAAGRALETDRPDALFKDPFAKRLAGRFADWRYRGLKAPREKIGWLVVRTVHLDETIRRAVRWGVDMVVNLAAGMDTRPYRMTDLPPTLRWIEVDLPAILDDKTKDLMDAKPACVLEQIRLDLSDPVQRRSLFERLGRESGRALVLTEGLLMYLRPPEVEGLARDLAAQAPFRFWVMDQANPTCIRWANETFEKVGSKVRMHFGPEDGARFFAPHGWKLVESRSVLHEAARANRLSPSLRLRSLLPGSRHFYEVCLLERK